MLAVLAYDRPFTLRQMRFREQGRRDTKFADVVQLGGNGAYLDAVDAPSERSRCDLDECAGALLVTLGMGIPEGIGFEKRRDAAVDLALLMQRITGTS